MNRVLLRKPTEIYSTMKLRYTTLAAALATSSAWVQAPFVNSDLSRGVIQHQFSKLTVRQMSDSSALKSTAVPEEVLPTASLTPTGKTIAEGAVVSFFRGGLAAVRVNDDDFTEPSQSPEVLDTTKSLPKELKKPSNLSKT